MIEIIQCTRFDRLLRKSVHPRYIEETMVHTKKMFHFQCYQVFLKWRELALIMRDKVFEEGSEEDIYIYDIKAKEWGYLLRELFGDRLGSGDYGHLTIEHSSMLFRRFRSFTKYSNQGFEALHRIQRQTYARATNHDSKSPGQSLEDIFLIHYAENLLFFRLSIHQALECYINGKCLVISCNKKLYFRGCGWQRAQAPMLSEENSKWLLTMKDLMEKMFGEDYLEYFYDKSTGTHVTEEMFPTYKYNHNTWEEEYDDYFQSDHIQSYFSTTKSVVPIKKRAKKSLFNTSNDQKVHSAPLHTSTPRQGTSDSPPCPSNTVPSPIPTTVNNKPTKRASKSLFNTSNDQELHSAPLHTSTPRQGTSDAPPCPSNTVPSPVPTVNNKPQMFCPVSAQASTHDLRICHINAGASRKQLANVILPTVQPIGDKYITVVKKPDLNSVHLSDPYTMKSRPSKSSLGHCNKILTELRNSGKMANVVGITFGNIGTFPLEHISLLHRYCEIADLRRDVISEAQWLNFKFDGRVPIKNIEALSSVLWDNVPSKVVLKVSVGSSTILIDVTSLACLVGERYVDNMVIDICLFKYMHDINSTQGCLTLVLPTTLWVWEGSDKEYFKEKVNTYVENCTLDFSNISQIVIPVYMPSHWGIVYIDFKERKLYFDDGMKFRVPHHLLDAAKHLLDILKCLHPVCTAFSSVWWKPIATLQRFGMPYQAGQYNNGQGSGSCGIGVIMAAKDLMEHGNKIIHNFTWSFAESSHHRNQIMLQILKWADK
ncbi:hypothetical protein QZH41_019373 [Actinostola sp. cb2023]|nr:hypothetical protein QZH41_019373 [Actinostola sp. cb2023]